MQVTMTEKGREYMPTLFIDDRTLPLAVIIQSEAGAPFRIMHVDSECNIVMEREISMPRLPGYTACSD